ncbi:MAG: ArsR family transcriptional regulator [Veillonellaceae bacterium]|nr:ArsR family transcriptional regulator [Veillonellaceae bacterium]
MKIRLGILGSEDSVQIVRSIADEYPDFSCQSIPFREISEIVPLFQAHRHDVDMWLLPGRIAGVIAREWGGVRQPIFQILYKGSSLYKTLCEIFYTRPVQLTEISFDSILFEDLKQVFVEMGIPEEPAYVRPFEIGMTEEVGAAYHYDLWRSGKTKLAVTCTLGVKRRLEALGVPVYRVLPARSAVESVLNLILRTAEMQQARDAQIAVQMFEVDTFSRSREFQSADDLFAMEMNITQKLIAYAKSVQGALKTASAGRFAVFTTRGMVREATADFSALPAMEAFRQIDSYIVACGTGIGHSAYEAEFNAARALLMAKERDRGSWMVFFDDKTILGPLGGREQIAYEYASERLREISRRTSVSLATLGRLASIWEKNRQSGISAQELALQLHVLPRSARRILGELERTGLAEVVGEESPGPRGRPRKRYKFLLDAEQE